MTTYRPNSKYILITSLGLVILSLASILRSGDSQPFAITPGIMMIAGWILTGIGLGLLIRQAIKEIPSEKDDVHHWRQGDK